MSVPFGHLKGIARGIPRALCGEGPKMGSLRMDLSKKSLCQWGGQILIDTPRARGLASIDQE